MLNELSEIIKDKNAKLRKIESLYNALRQENARLQLDNKQLKAKNDILIRENVLLSNTFLNKIDNFNQEMTMGPAPSR